MCQAYSLESVGIPCLGWYATRRWRSTAKAKGKSALTPGRRHFVGYWTLRVKDNIKYYSAVRLLESAYQQMKCPYCGFAQDRVVDSRESKEADSIRRRRECERCTKRFTTYERIDEIPYMVAKKDGRREKFDRQKVLGGLMQACQKRNVSASQLQQIVDEIEGFVVDSPERERSTSEVGELIMQRLKSIDTVAYIRFASVYRDFKDVREFKEELEELLGGKEGKRKR
jgi:transcriptional repressor NrdR